jgi:hypothetical protein
MVLEVSFRMFNQQTKQAILKQAVKAGINPGRCPVCKAELGPSPRVPLAKVPEMSTAISFDCPVSPEHIEAANLTVYRVTKA